MHTQLSQYKKTMAIIMLFVFLFSQIAIAAAPQQQSPYTDPNTTPAANSQPPVFTDNSGQAVLGTADSLSNYYFNQFKNSWGWDWLKTTNINFSAFSGGKPQWNINTFQPLTMKENLNNFLFAQGQYGTNTNTVNVGLGYRSMDANHSSMYGVNLFYDWQTTVQGEGAFTPTGSHMRVGAGLEYFTGSIETRINGYYGVSSDVQVGAPTATGITAFQHVAPGGDFSIGSDFSFWNAPWLKLTATGNYYQQTQSGTINGYQGSPLYGNLTAQLQVTPQLSINGGGTVGNGGTSSANVGFQLNLLAPPTPALFMADPTLNKLAQTDIGYKMLQPVQRNNTITVERYTKTTASINYSVAITYGQTLFVPALYVTAKDTSGNIVATSTTSATTGAVSISVPSGNYNFYLNYFNNEYLAAGGTNIEVAADKALELSLPSAVQLGNIVFSLVNQSGDPILATGVPFSFSLAANAPAAAVPAATLYATLTDESGAVAITGAPIGNYDGSFNVNDEPIIVEPVQVAPNETKTSKGTATPAQEQLIRESLINWHFNFTDENGNTLEDVLLTAPPSPSGYSGSPGHGSYSNAKSANYLRSTLEGLACDWYWSAFGPNGETLVGGNGKNTFDPKTGGKNVMNEHTFVLQSTTPPTTPSAIVTLLKPDGTPFAGQNIIWRRGSYPTVVTNSNGEAFFYDLFGSCTFSVGGGANNVSPEVTITSGETKKITLKAVAMVTATVKTSDDAPAANVGVEITDGSGFYYTMNTNSLGQAQFTIGTPGNYTCYIRSLSSGEFDVPSGSNTPASLTSKCEAIVHVDLPYGYAKQTNVYIAGPGPAYEISLDNSGNAKFLLDAAGDYQFGLGNTFCTSNKVSFSAGESKTVVIGTPSAINAKLVDDKGAGVPYEGLFIYNSPSMTTDNLIGGWYTDKDGNMATNPQLLPKSGMIYFGLQQGSSYGISNNSYAMPHGKITDVVLRRIELP
ncbi:MAG: inverse autotransporter beta domain-containing protein [Bacillota bacterium]